jgi:2-dehydropantoate 2-reductase
MFRINLSKKRGESSKETRKHSSIKIGIVGMGRTGSMFFQELKGLFEIFGISKKEDVEMIKKGMVWIKRNGKEEILSGNFLLDDEFNHSLDFLFFTVKNPVGPAISFYFKKIKEKKLKIPAIFLSQNGIEAGEETISVLEGIFGKKAEEIPVFRISLFNPVDREEKNGKILISYSLPVKMAIAQISGPKIDVSQIFERKNFKVFFIDQKNAKNMEYSKLLLNLIGIPSATHGLSIKDGFSKKEIFKEEILALREYKKVVKLSGGKFLNFPGYPVKFLSFLISLPISFLSPFREILAEEIERGRAGKKKDLDEIDYYNGAVLKMAEKLKVEVPINSKILERVKK